MVSLVPVQLVSVLREPLEAAGLEGGVGNAPVLQVFDEGENTAVVTKRRCKRVF